MGILEEGRNAIPTTTEKRMSTISPNILLHNTSRRSQIMIIAILKLENHLSMRLGTLTLKDQQLDMMFIIAVDMVLVLPNS